MHHAARPFAARLARGPAALLAASLLLLAGCASLTKPWQAPEVALEGLRVKEVSLARQTLIATLALKNPNDRTLPIKAMTYRLSLEGNEIAQGGGALARQIPAGGTERVDVEVVASVLGILPQLPALALKNEPVKWTVAGTATVADGLLTLPYRWSGTIDPKELLARAQTYSR